MTMTQPTGMAQVGAGAPETVEAALPWWKTAVVYQVYPRSFADASGDGIGDLRGVLEHLDHLSYLGVDTVWLCPIYASPQDDNGYDISDYLAIDPTFGTLEDLDRLIAELHARGMRLVMDLVVNHTSDEHQWFVQSASGPDNPWRDWYWWRPPRPGFEPGASGAEPTNWESFFSGSAWQLDPGSGEYYLHLFSAKQPDLNWENPDVRRAVYEIMGWWLDRGVDGFRMDVANLYSKDVSLPDGTPAGDGGHADGSPHYVDGPRIHEFLAEMRRAVAVGRPQCPLLVAEAPGVSLDQAQRYTDPASAEVDMVFQFEHVGIDHGPGGKFDPRPVDRRALRHCLNRWQTGLAEPMWNSLYWGNHDQPRAVSRFGDDRDFWAESATLLATVLYLQRGTPFLFQGEEIGMTNMAFGSIDDFRDIESIRFFRRAMGLPGARADGVLASLATAGRDNARTPMQWTGGRNAGFSAGDPWICVNPNHRWLNVDAQRGVPGSVLEHYRAVIALRRSEPALISGSFDEVLADHPTVYAYTRTWRNTQILVVANMSGEPTSAAVGSRWADAEPLLGNYSSACGPAAELSLRPWESVVLRRSVS